MKRSVLVTRPQPAADAMALKLQREGFEVHVAPLMMYVARPFSMPDLEGVQALVFTSAQAVDIFSAKTKVREMPVFTVGDATAKAASDAGFLRIFSASGDGDALVVLMISKKEALGLKRVLHVTGEDTAKDLSRALAPSGISIGRLIVYKAEIIDRIPADVERVLLQGKITDVTLFSERAAAHFANIMRRKDFRAASANLNIICVSNRVAASIKDVPWKSVAVAAAPTQEGVMDILRQKMDNTAGHGSVHEVTAGPLPSAPVVKAFGGLRPLANRLGITASTVQGWLKRGVIPPSRRMDVLTTAKQHNVNLEDALSMTEEEKKEVEKAFTERRRNSERRVRHTPLDDKQQIRTTGYIGPDRRTGMDRRAFNERQAQRVRDEKWKFVNRTVISFAFFFTVIVSGALFLLAPEYAEMEQKAASAKQLEAQMREMKQELAALQAQKAKPSMGAMLSHQIDKVQSGASDMGAAAKDAAASVVESAVPTTKVAGIQALLKVLGGVQALNNTSVGRAAVDQSMENLHAMLAGAENNPDSINAAVDAARRNDPTLEALLDGVDNKDLGAAAMILVLSEFRGNVGQERPFKKDIQLLQKLFASDPAMKQSLEDLTPYAEAGVMNRETLNAEFKGLATDIVMAKLEGEELSVKEKALKRMERFVKMRKIDAEGDSVDAIVARAQIMLDKNDVQGALAELKKLEGGPAETAAPWMQQAEGHVAAHESSDILMQTILGNLSSSVPGSGGDLLTVIRNVVNAPAPGEVIYMSPALQKNSTGIPMLEPPKINTQ